MNAPLVVGLFLLAIIGTAAYFAPSYDDLCEELSASEVQWIVLAVFVAFLVTVLLLLYGLLQLQ